MISFCTYKNSNLTVILKARGFIPKNILAAVEGEEIVIYAVPSNRGAQEIAAESIAESKEKGKIILLTDLAKALKKSLDSAGLASWQATLELTLEASTGVLPGGKVGFKASLTLTSK